MPVENNMRDSFSFISNEFSKQDSDAKLIICKLGFARIKIAYTALAPCEKNTGMILDLCLFPIKR